MSGENRAWAVAEAPSGSTTGFPATPEALTWVGSAVPLAPRSFPFGIPRIVHAAAEVFLTVSAYAIWPAPALFGITTNVAARSVPRQGLADFTDPVVVTVWVIVCVCVTVTRFVLLPRQPAAVSPTAVRTSPAAARRPATSARR